MIYCICIQLQHIPEMFNYYKSLVNDLYNLISVKIQELVKHSTQEWEKIRDLLTHPGAVDSTVVDDLKEVHRKLGK